MPRGLSAAEKKHWQFIVENIDAKIVGKIDTVALLEMVKLYDIYTRARAVWASDPTDKEARMSSCHAYDRWLRLANAFGLTPLARSNMKVENVAPKDDEAKPFASLMAG